MVTLSACVITKNEEKNIKQWLQSIQQIANEMIVVDTGSTDKTVELARTAGAKVYAYSWKNDFADAKNFALNQAKGEWILFLDADEYFSEKTIQNVPLYINKIHGNTKIDAVNCPLIDIDADDNDRYMGTSRTVRIFRHDEKLCYEGKIHETLVHKGGILRLIEENSKIEVYHTGYSSSIIQDKLKRNLEILQMEIAEFGEKRRHYLYLLDCYYGLADYARAIDYAKKCVDEKVAPLGQESLVYRRWIDSLLFSGAKSEELLSVVELAIEKYPNLPEFYWNKGKFLFDQKNYVQAEECLRTALEKISLAKTKGASGTFETKLTFLYYVFGEIFRRKGNIEEALSLLIKSLEIDRYNKPALEALYKSIRQCDPVDIIEIFQHLYDGTKERDIAFIVSVLNEYPLDKVYIYYTQLLQKSFHQIIENNIFAGLCAARKYKEALANITEDTDQSYQWLIISIIIDKKEESYEMAKSVFPKIYQNVLDYLLDRFSFVLSSEETTIYQDVCSTMKALDYGYRSKEDKIIGLIKDKADAPVEDEQWFIELLSGKMLNVENLLRIIHENFAKEQIKTIIDAAVFICNVGFEDIGLSLLARAYWENQEDADLIYAYVFLLHAYGFDEDAIKIAHKTKNLSEELIKLLQEINGSLLSGV